MCHNAIHPHLTPSGPLHRAASSARRLAAPTAALFMVLSPGAARGAVAAEKSSAPPAAAVRVTPAPPAPEHLLRAAERALDAGDGAAADSLRQVLTALSPARLERQRLELLDARLAASRGDWRGAETRLRAWRASSERREGSGTVLFWLGWAALHQARLAEGDSLMVLASAYGDDARAQDALEYRFAALMENGPALQDYLRGLPESPLPQNLRLASLERVPTTSRLSGYARLRLALSLEAAGDTARSRPLLDTLAQNIRSIPGRRAAAYRALLHERRVPGGSPELTPLPSLRVRPEALKEWEEILVSGQQGVIAEIARKRIKTLRETR
jgi:hypothetical protein